MIESGSDPTPTTPLPPASKRGFLRDFLETVLLAVVLFLAINAISARVRVDGFSMRPTLDDGQYVLVSRLATTFGTYERGDIIVFRPPMVPPESLYRRVIGMPGEEEDYIKRLIGVPGDTIRVENGSMFINGMLLDEPYIAAAPVYTGLWEVPLGHVFVLGDNRNNSSDSHQWGLLPVENILGRAVLVYWPFSDWMIIEHHPIALAGLQP